MGAKNGALVVVFAWAFLALKPFAQMVDIMDSKPSTLVSIGDIGATIDDPRGSVRFTWTYTGEKDEDLFIIVNIVKQHVGYKPFPGTNGTFHRIPTTTDFIIFENIVYGGPGYVARFSSEQEAGENVVPFVVTCPKGANCDLDEGTAFSDLRSRDGFWDARNDFTESELLAAADPNNPLDTVFVRCPLPGVCHGGLEAGANPCTQGYQGVACTACERDFTRVARHQYFQDNVTGERFIGTETCEECYPSFVIILLTYLAPLGTTVIALFLARLVLLRSSKRRPADVALARSLLSHLQLLFSLSLYPIDFPDGIRSVWYVGRILFVNGGVNGFVCAFPDLMFYARFLYTPLAAAGGLFIMVLILPVMGVLSGTNVPDTLVTGVIAWNSCFYLFLSNSVLLLFSCERIMPERLGESDWYPWDTYLSLDPNVKCWTALHEGWALGFSIPIIVVICIGIPLWLARGIYTAHHQKVPSAVMRYRVCYGSYMSEYYYWELVVLARKVSFQLPALYLSTSNDDPMRSILYGIVIVVISIILQALARPFRSSLLNRVELLGLIVVFFSLASCGLTITTKRHRYLTRSDTSLSGVQAFYFVMFVVVNLAYIVYVLRTISRNWNADVKKRGSNVHTKGGHKRK